MQVDKQTSQNELMENVNVEIQDNKLLAETGKGDRKRQEVWILYR